MKEKLQQVRKLLLLAVLGVTLAAPAQIQAAPEQPAPEEEPTKPAAYECDVTIPVTVQVNGSGIPEGNEYTVVLSAEAKEGEETPGTPMPAGAEKSEDGTKWVVSESIADGGTVNFQIRYTAPGDYSYTIHQEAQPKDHFSYDTAVYHVTVRVTNNFDTGGLNAEIWGYRNEDKENKVKEFIFQNTYSRPADPGSSDDGGGGGSHEDDTPVVQPAAAVSVTPPAQVILPPASQTGMGPQTGDEANVMLWAAGALLGAAALVILIFLGKKKKEA